MSARVWLAVAGGLVVLLGLAGGALWYSRGQAMYAPGGARANLAAAPVAPVAPAAAAGPDVPGFWRVTPTVALRHFEAGSGTDVLVVHGGPGLPPLRPWAASELTGDHVHWIFYQQRGCGESTRPFDRPPQGNLYRQMQAVEGTLGLGAQVADIERIRQRLGRDKLVLLGHSFGGLIAALYAAEFPEHVQALVLVAPANLVLMPADGPDLYHLVGDRLPATVRGEYAAYLERMFDFRALFRQDERSLARTFMDFQRFYAVAAGSTGSAAAPASAVPAAPVSAVPAAGASAGGARASALPHHAAPGPDPAFETPAGGWVTVGLYLSLGRRHDWRAALSRVQAPVLVLHGALDLVPESASRQFAGFFPHARVQVIPGAGHFSFDERPREFAEALQAFLAERS